VGNVKIDVRDNIDEFLAGLNHYSQDAVEQAIPRALNRTGTMAITATAREIRAQGYNFKASEIKAAVKMSKANRARLETTLRVSRQTKSLMAFGATQTSQGVRVKVHGAAKVIKHAFIGQLRNGRLGVYVEDKTAGKTVLRTMPQSKGGGKGGWHDYPVRKLNGPSVGGVYGTDRIQSTVVRVVNETFDARLAHELRYLSR
jgi:hypothetical protein